jgi:hypothetical protein
VNMAPYLSNNDLSTSNKISFSSHTLLSWNMDGAGSVHAYGLCDQQGLCYLVPLSRVFVALTLLEVVRSSCAHTLYGRMQSDKSLERLHLHHPRTASGLSTHSGVQLRPVPHPPLFAHVSSTMKC